MSLAPLYISNVTFTVSPGKGAVPHDFTCICPEEFQAEARSLSPSSCKELSLLRDAAYRPRSAGPWWWCWGCWRWRSASSWERPTWATALDLVVLDQKRCAHWLGCLHHYPSSWPIYRQRPRLSQDQSSLTVRYQFHLQHCVDIMWPTPCHSGHSFIMYDTGHLLWGGIHTKRSVIRAKQA